MPPFARIRTALASSLVALTAVLASGCESAVLRVANLGLDAPEVTLRYSVEPDLSLDIYRPLGNDGPAPTVVFFYGGGWQRGERAQYRFVGRRLAQEGLLVIVADYRTYPDARFPSFVEDAARAVAWSHQNAARYGGDPARLFVAGHSAGAQIAALLATDARYLRAEGLEPTALAGAIGLSGPYDFVISGKYRRVFGPVSQWPQAQAINFVDGAEPPFLLVHGTGDRVVAARNSVQLARKLTANDVHAELLLLDDAGHSAPLLGLYDPRRSPQLLPALLGFIDATSSAQTAN